MLNIIIPIFHSGYGGGSIDSKREFIDVCIAIVYILILIVSLSYLVVENFYNSFEENIKTNKWYQFHFLLLFSSTTYVMYRLILFYQSLPE